MSKKAWKDFAKIDILFNITNIDALLIVLYNPYFIYKYSIVG